MCVCVCYDAARWRRCIMLLFTLAPFDMQYVRDKDTRPGRSGFMKRRTFSDSRPEPTPA